jgi:cell division protease FtsH
MVAEYGMSPKIGPRSFGKDGFRGGGMMFPGSGPELSDELASLIDEEVSRLVNEAHSRATEALTEHRSFLEQMSKILIQTEVIDGDDLLAYFDGSKPIPSAEQLRQDAAGNGQVGPSQEETPTGPDIVLQPPA